LLQAFGAVVEAVSPSDAVAALGRHAPDAVVTFAESTVPSAAAVAAAYGLPGHSPEIAERLTDKWVQRRRLNAFEIGGVATVEVCGGQPLAQLPELPLPGVLKPREGAGSRDTLFVESVAEVAGELALHPSGARFVVESRIVDSTSPFHPRLADYLSVESAVVGDTIVHLGFTGRLPLAEPARERGLVFPIGLTPTLERDLQRLASAAITALGVGYGLVHTEIKVGADGPQVIEVNARLGGGLASIVPAAGGPDLVGLAVDLALGCPVPDLPTPTGVALHLYVQPPYDATELVVAPDPKALRALPGVYGVDRRARPGDRTDWRSGSAGRILDVWVKAGTLDELLRCADAIEAAVARTTQWSRG
jgi:biotin carboxylase